MTLPANASEWLTVLGIVVPALVAFITLKIGASVQALRLEMIQSIGAVQNRLIRVETLLRQDIQHQHDREDAHV